MLTHPFEINIIILLPDVRALAYRKPTTLNFVFDNSSISFQGKFFG